MININLDLVPKMKTTLITTKYYFSTAAACAQTDTNQVRTDHTASISSVACATVMQLAKSRKESARRVV